MTTERIDCLLPIGSVVLLTGASKPLMIYGVCQTHRENGKEYDYLGVMWPEGSIGADVQFLFNHNEVAQVLHRGLDGEAFDQFIEKLKAHYTKAE